MFNVIGSVTIMSIVNYPAYYIEAFKLFSLKMGRFEVMKELAGSVFVTSVVERLKTDDTNIRSLGIGSSTGNIESLFIERLLDCFPNIENTVVEPNAEAIAEYESSIKGKWNNVEFSWFNGTFKQFREQLQATGNDKKFHHISSIDSVYYLDNPKDDIQFMYDRLEDGGIIMVLVISAENSISKIEQRFPKLLQEKCITSNDLINICNEKRIPFECYHHECHNDITGFYSSAIIPRDEKLLLDFWIQMKDFQENVSKSVYDEVIEFIKSPDCSKRNGDKVLFRNDFDMVLIKK